jgi:hypothetical protein
MYRRAHQGELPSRDFLERSRGATVLGALATMYLVMFGHAFSIFSALSVAAAILLLPLWTALSFLLISHALALGPLIDSSNAS